MPSSTLSARRDIRAVYASRHVVHGSAMTLRGRIRTEDGENPGGRAAVVAARKVGNAVARNRAKRRLRAVLRAEGVPGRVDLVLAAKPTALTAPYPALLAEYRRLRDRLVRAMEAEPRSARGQEQGLAAAGALGVSPATARAGVPRSVAVGLDEGRRGGVEWAEPQSVEDALRSSVSPGLGSHGPEAVAERSHVAPAFRSARGART